MVALEPIKNAFRSALAAFILYTFVVASPFMVKLNVFDVYGGLFYYCGDEGCKPVGRSESWVYVMRSLSALSFFTQIALLLHLRKCVANSTIARASFIYIFFAAAFMCVSWILLVSHFKGYGTLHVGFYASLFANIFLCVAFYFAYMGRCSQVVMPTSTDEKAEQV